MEHRTTQLDSVSGLDDSRKAFIAKIGRYPEELAGKTVLDAGCGAGRYTEIAIQGGAIVTAFDVSPQITTVAKLNVPSAKVVTASIFDMPFKEQFDFVFSLGVLHHTGDAYRAFHCLDRVVKPGGELAVWVYSAEGTKQRVYNAIADAYRVFTTRIPLRLLYALCHIAIPMYYLYKIPVLRLLLSILPCSTHPGADWRVLDTFDWYAPKHQSRHTYAEVEGWFKELGYVGTQRLPFPVAVRGRKPCAD